jgi:hypothetical protein
MAVELLKAASSSDVVPRQLGLTLATAGMLLLLLGCHDTGQRAQRGCGVTAKLQGIGFPAVYNPNSLELRYLVANDSGRDYQMPDTFRALRRSRDNVLHPDSNLALPLDRFFPRGHTVEFSVWVDLGNVLSHAPKDEREKADLERQLAGTHSYVLFDERNGCEIELPVDR